jgi:hypothetical protein
MKINAAARLHSVLTKEQVKSKTQKLQNKAIARTQVRAIELPKFRYIDDVSRFLDTMAEEVDDTDKLIKVYQTQLAYLKRPGAAIKAALVKAAEMEMTITQDGDKKSYLKRKIDNELPKIELPTGGLKKLKEQYALSEDLYEKHRTLEAVETQIAMQFPDRRGEAYAKTMESLNELKSKVAKQLKSVLGFLNEIAAKHVPKTFEKYIDAVRQEVQEHVFFEDYDLFLYVSISPEGEIVFTYYLMLKNATNDEGEVTPTLYISVQWIVGQTTTIHLNPEYELPNQLLKEGGTEVGSAGEAVKAISDLLAIEDFSSSLGTVPLSTQLRKPASELKPEMFTYKDFIQKLEVDNDKLVFKLRKGIDAEQLKEIGYALFQEVKSLFKNSRTAKVRMKPSTTQIEFTVTNIAKGAEVSTYDAEFLVDKFGISEQQLRKIVNVLNNPKGKKEEPETPGGKGEDLGGGWEFKQGERPGEAPKGKEKVWL